MKMKLLCMACAILMSSVGAWAGNSSLDDTADPLSNSATHDVLLYLQHVGERARNRIVIGQHFGSPACCSMDELPEAAWNANISSLYDATGKYPGMVGADYNDFNFLSKGALVDYATLNSYLISAWQAGMLVEISWHPANPWTGGAWNDTRCNGGTLGDLVNPSAAVYVAWRAKVNRIASGLKALQKAGVIVLWRPLLEQNSSNWWYVSCRNSDSQFVSLWRDLFGQLTGNYALHNLLWVYSSNGPWGGVVGCPQRPGEDGLCLYPGAAFVDVVGVDDYSDRTGPMPDAWPGGNWSSWKALDKVVALTERGPHTADGRSKVYETLIDDGVAVHGSSQTAFAYTLSWFDKHSIASNPGASSLMNNRNAATRDDVSAALSCMSQKKLKSDKIKCILQ